jgi:predicted MPP superfamily phosphohydrolase
MAPGRIFQFTLFLITALGLYALLHAYALSKVRAAFPLPLAARVLILLAFGALILAPFGTRMLERAGWVGPARIVGVPANLWMAVLFWFCSLGLAADLWNLAVRLAGTAIPLLDRTHVPPRALVLAAAVAIPPAVLWGLVEASAIRTRELHVSAPGLPPASPPIRIVQISDVHLSIFRGPALLARVLRRIREARPDLLVSTGDLVDASFADLAPVAGLLAAVEPPLGKLAVLGNHEYFAGLDHALALHRAAGFRLLREEAVDVSATLRVAGVDDPAGIFLGEPCYRDEQRAGLGAGPSRFTLLLKHQPMVAPALAGRSDLQLSGHVHGGQIFPFGWVMRLLYRLGPGLHRLAPDSAVYVSRGAGTWGPPLRLFAPPEITLIVLEPPAG